MSLHSHPFRFISQALTRFSSTVASNSHLHLSLSVKEKEGNADEHGQGESWEAETTGECSKFKKQLDASP
ncbi:hypothetical protein V6N13_110486 [Hibiscus sabdariffa]